MQSMAIEKKKDENGVMDRDEQMILSLLTAIESEPNITQQGLATQLGVAVGLVNSYLKRVIYKGMLKQNNYSAADCVTCYFGGIRKKPPDL